ncbi:MAG: outer membrane protein [Beijerinckiaceae bacterium]
MFRKLLLSTVALVAVSSAAFAADLPSRSAPPVYIPPPPVFSWTGVYIGGQVGYQWGTTTTAYSNAAGAYVSEPSVKPNGVVGGAHIGYNLQFSQIVVGLEGDVDGSSYKGSGTDTLGVVSGVTRTPVEGSLRGRVGVAWDRALIYGTGGAAFGDLHTSLTSVTGTDTFNDGRVGWTVGGGIEYAVTNNWSVRAEYRYTDFGKFGDLATNSSAVFVGNPYTLQRHDTDNAVRIGFSYKFGEPPAPVVAKY